MSASADFSLNGRFLTQPVTGVQRYARNVAAAMSDALFASAREAPILAPAGAVDPGLRAMPLQRALPLGGHLWEQTVLPAHCPGRLLNLCNTAPAAKADQVVCIHDASVFDAPESYSAGFRAFYRALQPRLARRAARITTVSAYSARQIARHFPVRTKDIVVLPNGHEHALAWNPGRAQIAPALVGDDFRPFVLAIGSRARHKNLALLVEAAPALADLGLDVIIAGGGGSVFAPAQLQGAPNVKLIDRLSDDDLAYLMQRAVCLAFPSWTEGFGLPLVEAMARGCPIVSSDRASMPDICGDAALMAAPDDPAAWLRQVRALQTSPDLRQTLVERGRLRMRQFSWAETAAGYIELMRDPARRKQMSKPEMHLPKIAVVVATLGRPEIVSATVCHLLEHQTLQPHAVILSCVSREDAGDALQLPAVQLVLGRPGLPAQRNAALAALPLGIDVVAFFDDDFVADPGWLAAAAEAFQSEPDIIGFTGHVLVDDIKGPGLSFAEAANIVRTAASEARWSRVEPYSPYGCNMAFRMSAIGDAKFDERLVLYGWLEDRDFAASLAKRGGRLIKCASARGVHMGVKRGRVAGDRLGYSQIINPLYMLRKGTMSMGQVIDHIFRNVASNLARAAKPEPFIDRRGRLRGNLLALADVLRGRLQPERAATLQLAAKGK